MPNFAEEFTNKGYIIVRNFFSKNECKYLYKLIYQNLKNCAKELEVTLSNYLHCTGRWAQPSNVFPIGMRALDKIIANALNNYLEQECILTKQNLMFKNQNTFERVPFHQDISYSPKDPYDLTFWLALTDIDANNGALQFIENSHKLTIKPAVDFWAPEYEDIYFKKYKYKPKLKTISLQAGDCVIFDSKLWHGSNYCYSRQTRLAYATRWKLPNREKPEIPEIIPNKYGMWKAEEEYLKILKANLYNFPKHTDINNYSKNEIIDIWINNLRKKENTSYKKFAGRVIQSLLNLKTLNQAAKLHNAGDLVGHVYKDLWQYLIKFLQ